MLKIYLVRHGQDEDNAAGILNGRRDGKLTSLGEAQAESLAEQIIANRSAVSYAPGKPYFSFVYCSPLERAHRTAKIICERLKLAPPQILPELVERDFGVMTGRRTDEIEKYCAPDILMSETIKYFLSPEGAETFPDLFKRAEDLLRIISERHIGMGERQPDENVLLVTHGDIGKMIYAAYYNLEWKSVLTQFHFGNSDLLLLSPDSRAEDAHVFKTEQFNA
ncbi:MAG: histidine phosphatase family protein [Patescibacteria group bacterium]